MSPIAIGATVEVACYDTSRVGRCFERDCPFQASMLIEASDGFNTGMVFACSRHRAEGMLAALAHHISAAGWADTSNQSPAA